MQKTKNSDLDPAQDLMEKFDSIDKEFEVPHGNLEQIEHPGDHIKLGVSDNEDQFISEEEENDNEAEVSSDEDSSIEDQTSSDEEGQADSDTEIGEICETEVDDQIDQSFAESTQSNVVILNPNSNNHLDEEQLDYLKGIPAFQNYVHKLVSEELREVSKEKKWSRKTDMVKEVRQTSQQRDKRGKVNSSETRKEMVKSPSEIYTPALKQVFEQNLLSPTNQGKMTIQENISQSLSSVREKPKQTAQVQNDETSVFAKNLTNQIIHFIEGI